MRDAGLSHAVCKWQWQSPWICFQCLYPEGHLHNGKRGFTVTVNLLLFAPFPILSYLKMPFASSQITVEETDA